MTCRYRSTDRWAGALTGIRALFTARFRRDPTSGLPERSTSNASSAGVAHLDARVMCEIESSINVFPVYAIAMEILIRCSGGRFFGGFHGFPIHRLARRHRLPRQPCDAPEVGHDVASTNESVNDFSVAHRKSRWHVAGDARQSERIRLMRNAPLDCAEGVPFVGGQRISARMPLRRVWQQGRWRETRRCAVFVAEELLTR